MTTSNPIIYHRKGFLEVTISNVLFTDDDKVTFFNNGHDCELLLAQFNEQYEILT